MRILVTGGCGFIGSFVAERFYKEGHQVWIIDNLSTGQRSNLTFSPTCYEMNVEDARCEEVFKSGKFDVVVHLAAQVDVETSVRSPQQDAQANIMGLLNMLRLSKAYGVKKFIFASSAAVYGSEGEIPLNEHAEQNPVSPYGIHKWFGEHYCQKWSELYELPTLCFRFSNVFGPRQGNSGEGGVVSIFIQRMLRNEQLIVYGDGGQTRDFIYVEDVADAIYRASDSYLHGVYNLSTTTETSIVQLIDHLADNHPIPHVIHKQPREGDIYRSSLDNSRLKRDLEWVPLYSVQEGLQKTFAWFQTNAQETEHRSNHPTKSTLLQRRSSMRQPWLPLLENMIAFLLVALLTLYPATWIQHLSLDFTLIYITLIGIIYGSRQAMIAVGLSTLLYFAHLNEEGREWVSLLFDTEVLFDVSMYLLLGLVLGFTTDKRLQQLRLAEQRIETQEERYTFLKKVFDDTSEMKDALERNMVNSKDSIGRLYRIVTEMESLEPEKVMTSAVSVLEQMLETDAVAIYAVSTGDYLRLRVHSKKERAWLKSLQLHDNHDIERVVYKQTPWFNRELNPNSPMMVAPVVFEGETIAIVTVYEMPFERMNPYAENAFRIAVDMFSKSLGRALQYSDAVRTDRYITGTQLLRRFAFEQMLSQKQEAKRKHHVPYVLIKIEGLGLDWKDWGARIVGALRDTDYVGTEQGDSVMALLSNTDESEVETVRARINQLGLTTRVIVEPDWQSREKVYG
ncbi:NAD-dependent epimerase/dehydratase family protein [Paenibacillus sp. 481]|uniref:NAD-dependent epimerase/dehydratase family protein n=1 Tax=Paenibacillus sp. 481 TaxID=2835869 RepID=UPI001E34BDB0|nr:NAD-dependent epimerase/dehydratase family protein [Paenibacillus sp. 481]UHA75202.1 NAD-dependent epimerase/dehydratase family protein [Paenibacillus sp. 481]